MSDMKNNSGDYNNGYYNSGDYNSGNRNSGCYNSGDYNSGDCNSGNRNSGYCNSGNYNSGCYNSGDRNSGYYNSGDRNSGDRNSGDYNSGDYNSGDRNSGMFNTNEPNARFFNADCGCKLSELINDKKIPYFGNFLNLLWIETSEMTEDEKQSNPSHKTTGGFLRKLSYKESWVESWKETTEENKKKLFALPNFSVEIFFEITGIDLREKKQEPEEPVVGKYNTIVIDGKTFNLVPVEKQ